MMLFSASPRTTPLQNTKVHSSLTKDQVGYWRAVSAGASRQTTCGRLKMFGAYSTIYLGVCAHLYGSACGSLL